MVPSIQQRYKELGACVACSISDRKHEDECSSMDIILNNKGAPCKRCGGTDHIFWTCDGKPHPGSQFKKSEKPFCLQQILKQRTGEKENETKKLKGMIMCMQCNEIHNGGHDCNKLTKATDVNDPTELIKLS